jgi:FtsZ-interacting cell division protein ZipA
MTSLQLGLIAGGVVLVVGVVVVNWVQERRLRRRLETDAEDAPAVASRRGDRVEPTLAASGGRGVPPVVPANVLHTPTPESETTEIPWEAPVETQARIVSDFAAEQGGAPVATRPLAAVTRSAAQPDPEIECMIALQPVRPVTAGALAAGLHARLGKRLRWFGRRDGGPWQLLHSDTAGDFTEIAACLLLADRSGAAAQAQIDGFARLVGDIAATLPAACVPPDTAHEVTRAEALDHICADLDVQIGLTVLKPGPATIPGTRLRGVAEAAGFRLADGGRFDWVQEETGAVLFSLTNYRSEPFTADALRAASTPGAVFLLDVPRVADPVRVFDQMKLAARRMAQTLDATLVDDNRRPLDDAAFAAIREQVQATAAALREVNIDPGGPRALALFGG